MICELVTLIFVMPNGGLVRMPYLFARSTQ